MTTPYDVNMTILKLFRIDAEDVKEVDIHLRPNRYPEILVRSFVRPIEVASDEPEILTTLARYELTDAPLTSEHRYKLKAAP